MHVIFRRMVLLCLLSMFCSYVKASHFISLKTSMVNLRVGPGKEYPIIWMFMVPNVPMMLIAEFDQWRKLRFVDNSEGWAHQNLISNKNTAIITENYAILYKYASDSHPIAKIEKNVIVKVLKQEDGWVKIDANGTKGWIRKKCAWGVSEE